MMKGENKKIYAAWSSMKQRCSNPRNDSYAYYGGKGITFCERWKDFLLFNFDMEQGWFEGAILDRVDNSKDYSPENCRWVTRINSQRNRSNVKVNTDIAEEVRRLYQEDVSQRDIARRLNIGHRTVFNIVHNIQWN